MQVGTRKSNRPIIKLENSFARFEQCWIESPFQTQELFGYSDLLFSHSTFEKPFHNFVLKQSTIVLNAASSIELGCAAVHLIDNVFTGNSTSSSTIKFGKERKNTSSNLRYLVDLTEAEVVANTFSRMHLRFGTVPRNKITLRNNVGVKLKSGKMPEWEKWMPPSQESFGHCDSAGSGLQAHCDVRARCSEPSPGDVQCRCVGAVKPVRTLGEIVEKDGSLCTQKPAFDVTTISRDVDLVIKKPQNSEMPIHISASGDNPFDLHVQVIYIETGSDFLRVDVPYINMSLSAAKSQDFRQILLQAIGSRCKWPDAEERHAIVQASLGAKVQTLNVSVTLRPYPSCRCTNIDLTVDGQRADAQVNEGEDGVSAVVKHNKATIQLKMFCRDTDGHSISKNACLFKVQLIYESSEPASHQELPVVRDRTNTSIYTSAVPQDFLQRAGRYRLAVGIVKGWNHIDSKVVDYCTPETLPTMSFGVKCAQGFDNTRDGCKPIDFAAVCANVKLSIDGEVLARSRDKKASGLIDETAVLNIKVNVSGDKHTKIRSVPLRDSVEKGVTAGRAALPMKQTGDFSVELLQNGSSCQLLSKLKLQCKTGYRLAGTQCKLVVETNLQAYLGMAIGVVCADHASASISSILHASGIFVGAWTVCRPIAVDDSQTA